MMNRNILLTIIFTFLDGVTQGIWGMAALGPYLNNLTHDNSHTGYSEGIQGTLVALFALPAGFSTDKIGRERVLLFSCILGLFSLSVLLYGLLVEDGLSHKYDLFDDGRPNNWLHRYVAITIGLACFGAYQGCYYPGVLTIFSDSIPNGKRSKYETWRYIASIISEASGPVMNIMLLAFAGDIWSYFNMTLIFVVGVALTAIPICTLLLFKEKYSIHHKDQDEAEENENDDKNEEKIKHNLEIYAAKSGAWYHLPASQIPLVVAIADMIGGIAAGMTIKFFPLFLKNELDLGPIAVNFIFCLTPIFMVVFSLAAQRLSKYLGRIHLVVGCNVAGCTLLILMGYFKNLWKTQPYIIVAFLVLRTAFMNCTYPLLRSVLMDFVPKENSGKWNSLESIGSFGWSGSAVLGGVMVDKYGYGSTFYITAGVALLSTAFKVILLPVVPLELSDDGDDHETDFFKEEEETEPLLKSQQQYTKENKKGAI